MARLSLLDTVGASWAMIGRHAGAFLATQGVFLLPLTALTLALILALPPEGVTLDLDALRAEAEAKGASRVTIDVNRLVDLGIAGDLAAPVLGLLGLGIAAAVADQRLRSGPGGVAAAWRRPAARAPTLLGSVLVLAAPIVLLVTLGNLLATRGQPVAGLLIAAVGSFVGVLALIRFAFLVPVIVLEDGGVGDSLRRALALSRGNGWKIFWTGIALVLPAVLVVLVVGIPLGLAGAFMPLSQQDLAGTMTITRSQILASWAFEAAASWLLALLFGAAAAVGYRQLAASASPPAAAPVHPAP